MEDYRDLLIYFALKYKGDWKNIFKAISEKEKVDEEDIKKYLSTLTCKCITILDKEYPKQFKEIYQPPFVLFYYGDISLVNRKNILGIVGSRNPTTYGEQCCKYLLLESNINDLVVISGLAKGIDAIAHETSLMKGYKTIAVLGNGIDACYPKENFKLYQKIKNNGLIISEYPYKEIVSKNNFALRNRIIAGLSNKILIPDVKKKSGTLITIRFALNFGKDILVVPCSIFDERYNNQLIYEGAVPISTPKELEREIN